MDYLKIHFNEELYSRTCQRCKCRESEYRVFIKNFQGKDVIVELCFMCVKAIVFVNSNLSLWRGIDKTGNLGIKCPSCKGVIVFGNEEVSITCKGCNTIYYRDVYEEIKALQKEVEILKGGDDNAKKKETRIRKTHKENGSSAR